MKLRFLNVLIDSCTFNLADASDSRGGRPGDEGCLRIYISTFCVNNKVID